MSTLGAGAIRIRDEASGDAEAVGALLEAAFEGPGETALVATLRGEASPLVSLVAEEDGAVLGHILFSPVTVTGHPDLELMGLAPMAVAPAQQRGGIGSRLVREGLDACRSLGAGGVVVLGHAEYYPRFGFRPASRFGLGSEYEVPDEVFMALELVPGYLASVSGTARYHPAFGAGGL